MAVTIEWNDEDRTIRSYDSATSVEADTPRGPFRLFDKEGKPVAIVPDFGVQVIAFD